MNNFYSEDFWCIYSSLNILSTAALILGQDAAWTICIDIFCTNTTTNFSYGSFCRGLEDFIYFLQHSCALLYSISQVQWVQLEAIHLDFLAHTTTILVLVLSATGWCSLLYCFLYCLSFNFWWPFSEWSFLTFSDSLKKT